MRRRFGPATFFPPEEDRPPAGVRGAACGERTCPAGPVEAFGEDWGRVEGVEPGAAEEPSAGLAVFPPEEAPPLAEARGPAVAGRGLRTFFPPKEDPPWAETDFASAVIEPAEYALPRAITQYLV